MIPNATIRAFVEHFGGGNPEQLVRARVLELLDESGQTEPRVSLLKLIPYCPVPIVPRVHVASLPHDAQMTRGSDGFEITVDKDRSRGRQRFSVAHEIGHSLFLPFRDEGDSARHRDTSIRLSDHEDGIEERLCNVAAAEMLMPAGAFSRDLAKRPFTPWSIVTLARLYDVSFHAAALRAGEVTDADLLAGEFEWDKTTGSPRFIWYTQSESVRKKGSFRMQMRNDITAQGGRLAVGIDFTFEDGSYTKEVVALQSRSPSTYRVATSV